MKTITIYKVFIFASIFLLLSGFIELCNGEAGMADMSFPKTSNPYFGYVGAGEGGTVTPNGFVSEHNVVVVATPNENYRFDAWYLQLSQEPYDENAPWNRIEGNSTATLTITAYWRCVFLAKFTSLLPEYMVKIVVLNRHFEENSNLGFIKGAGKYQQNTEVKLSALNTGNDRFAGWYSAKNSDALISTDGEIVFTCTKDTTFYVLYNEMNEQKWNVKIIMVDDNFEETSVGGEVEGAGDYYDQTEIHLEAKPATGYHLQGWYSAFHDYNSLLTYNLNYYFTCTSNTTLYAQFMRDKAVWNVTVSGDGHGDAAINRMGNTSQGVMDGLSANLLATPNAGYYFVGWFDGNTAVSPKNPYTIYVIGNVDLTARFSTDPKATGNIADWTNSPYYGGDAH